MNYRLIILLTIVHMILQPVSSQGNSEIRNFIKTLPAGKETELEVLNKYGTIEITQWKKDSVMIRAEIKAVASNREKLDKMFDGVSISMNESKYQIRAETKFTQNIGMVFENFKGMTSKLISYDSRVEINYYISIPGYINLKIENKYGDVYMEDITGDFSISLSNGSFKANSLGKNSTLNLSFCDAAINSIASGRIDASFSELKSDELGEVSINSISSKYEIKKAGTVTIESRRDKFYIDDIKTIKGTSYFTDFNIKRLRAETSLSTRYGNLTIDQIDNGFESVNLNTGYSDVSLAFEPGSSYNLDIRHLNAFLVISDKNAKTEKKVLNEDKKEYITSGTVGKSSSGSRVSIDATHGDIYLK
ncbi:MAG: hypothetical protein IPJ37_00095 [Bacteroidales bacterium]|nr:hypothetical protein [Bacteroidales bacterium]